MQSESKKCSACGQEMSISVLKCPNCGAVDVKRNSFVSFWLWLCTIINGLCTVGYFALLFSSRGLWSGTPEPTWLRLIWLVGSAIVLCGYIMLLKWNKKGFYLFSGMCVVNIIISLLTNGFVLDTFSPIFGIVLLYIILQIEKDGVGYWEAMEMKE